MAVMGNVDDRHGSVMMDAIGLSSTEVWPTVIE